MFLGRLKRRNHISEDGEDSSILSVSNPRIDFINLSNGILEINKKGTEDTSYRYHQRC
jgi:hypothetical protein